MGETSKRTDQPNQPERITVRDLSRVPRGLFALAGMSGLIAGGFAVFDTGNQAGSVALLAVGSVASLLAVVGKVPLKWIIGGNEFDLSETAAQEAADAVASQLTPAQTAELLGRLASIDAGRPSQMTLAMADYVSFEQYAITRVAAAASEGGWTFASTAQDAPFDGYVAIGAGVQVPIKLKLIRGEQSSRRLRDLVGHVRELSVNDLVMVLSGMKVDRQTVEDRLISGNGPRVHVVYLEDPQFNRNLVAAVERAIPRNVR